MSTYSLVDTEMAHDIKGNGVVDEFGNIVMWFGVNEDGSLDLVIRPGTEARRFVTVEAIDEVWFK